MNTTAEHNQKFVTITFAAVYQHYVKKVESKGRTLAELHEVTNWLTGFDEKNCKNLLMIKPLSKHFLAKQNSTLMHIG